MLIMSIGSSTVSIAAATKSAGAVTASNPRNLMLISLSSDAAGVHAQPLHAIKQGAAWQPELARGLTLVTVIFA